MAVDLKWHDLISHFILFSKFLGQEDTMCIGCYKFFLQKLSFTISEIFELLLLSLHSIRSLNSISIHLVMLNFDMLGWSIIGGNLEGKGSGVTSFMDDPYLKIWLLHTI